MRDEVSNSVCNNSQLEQEYYAIEQTVTPATSVEEHHS